MNPILRFFYKRPRVYACLALFIGITATIRLLVAHHSGESFPSDELTMAPLGLLIGLVGMMEPRIITAWNPEANPPIPGRFKGIGIALAVVIIAISLYIQQAYFKEWKRAPLSEIRPVIQTEAQ